MLYTDEIAIAVYVLLGFAVLFALLTIEFRDIIRAVLSFAMMSILIGGVFWLLGAGLVALFQILVYAGAIVVLFLITTMLAGSR